MLSAFLVSRIEEGPIPDKKSLTVKKKGFSLDKLICFPAVPAAILLLFNGLIHTCISNYLSLYGLERNLENVGFFFTINAVTMIAVRPLTGRRGDANGTFYVGGDIGLALGAYGAGAIFDAAGSMAMYLFMASMAVLCILFYIVYQFHIRLKKQSAPAV